tara:strand:+ start:1007 stop:1255 length:249 start_codon:yes stop_codon:yes gene_type:complete
MPFSQGEHVWLTTVNRPRRVKVMRQVLHNQSAYRVRRLSVRNEDTSTHSFVVDGCYLSREKPYTTFMGGRVDEPLPPVNLPD